MPKADRIEFLKQLLNAKDADEVLQIKQDAGVPQVCIDVDEY